MTTIRRIYAYLIALAGLGMLTVATGNLGRVLIDALATSRATNPESVRNDISLYAAGALVGLPVWLIHWLWTERWARSDTAERASTLRRLYLYAVLAGAMGILAHSCHDIVVALASGRVDLREVPFALIGLVAWIAHWRIVSRDRALVGERGGSATLRRWYVYGAALVGFVVLLSGASALLEAVWRMATQPTSGSTNDLSGPVASALVGLAVWLLHWRVLAQPADDGTALLRSVYQFLALTIAISGTLAGTSQLLYYAVGRLLGIARPGGVGGDLIQAAAAPASLAIVYSVAWAYQRNALRDQARNFDEAPRQVGLRRLYRYLVALVAVIALAVAVAGLLWTLMDVVLASSAATSGDGWRGNVAAYGTLAIVSLPMWLLYWRPAPGPESTETQSLARRLYLYLTMIGAMLSLVASAANALYGLLRVLLGTTWTISVAIDLAHSLAIAVVAGLVAAYHWRILRSDAPRVQPVAAEAPAQAVSQVIQIRAADSAALERALETLRSSGVEVAVIS
jgi:hypothetical protein